MKPHEQRVVDEKNALDEKLLALHEFIKSSPIHANLPANERVRLSRQRTAMIAYSEVLGERIESFPK